MILKTCCPKTTAHCPFYKSYQSVRTLTLGGRPALLMRAAVSLTRIAAGGSSSLLHRCATLFIACSKTQCPTANLFQQLQSPNPVRLLLMKVPNTPVGVQQQPLTVARLLPPPTGQSVGCMFARTGTPPESGARCRSGCAASCGLQLQHQQSQT